MEKLTKGTLLKAKDGSHYAIFSTYAEGYRSKAVDYPTEAFNAARLLFADGRVELTWNKKRNIADYEKVSTLEQSLVNSVEEKIADTRTQGINVSRTQDRLHLIENAWKEVESFSSLIKETEKVEGALEELKKELQTVINLTAKDYVKGEYILEVIKTIMPLVESIKRGLSNRENLKENPSKVTNFIGPLDE